MRSSESASDNDIRANRCERNVLSDQPSETHAIVNALRNVAFDDDVTLVRFLHHDPGRYSSFGGLGETAKYTVGRSMYETDSVPAHWVELCNDALLVEEVWVPTRFNALTFAQAGVSPDRLHVLPEPVDTALFSPAAAKPPAASDGGLRFEGVGTLHPIVTVLPCVHAPAPVAQPAATGSLASATCVALVLSFMPVATCSAFRG